MPIHRQKGNSYVCYQNFRTENIETKIPSLFSEDDLYDHEKVVKNAVLDAKKLVSKANFYGKPVVGHLSGLFGEIFTVMAYPDGYAD